MPLYHLVGSDVYCSLFFLFRPRSHLIRFSIKYSCIYMLFRCLAISLTAQIVLHRFTIQIGLWKLYPWNDFAWDFPSTVHQFILYKKPYFFGIDNYIYIYIYIQCIYKTLTSSLFIGHHNVMTNSPILNFWGEVRWQRMKYE